MDDALDGVEAVARAGADVEVSGVQYDSRKLRPGDCFVAMRGGVADGNRFIPGALERSASAVVTDSPEVFAAGLSVPVVLVERGRRALAGIAANLLGHPERKLKISAVTGTNGKTTTAFLLEQMLRSVGRKCVLIGTIETRIGDEVRASEHTTPEASDLYQLFADGVAAGCTEVVMEMSSHALDQERVWGVPVDVAIFTNLTQDHLDYHGTMERYFLSKLKLFNGVGAGPPRVAVVNSDDYYGVRIAREFKGDKMLYETQHYGDHYRAEQIEHSPGGTNFLFRTATDSIDMKSPLSGRVNVENLLAASCAALARGLTLPQIASAVEGLDQVPGRFQVVPGSQESGIRVVVDYAHTDDALLNLIALAREQVGGHDGRVITLFGCGGDRDKTKRPKMGRVAAEQSDFVVVTSDNPRSEEPMTIIEEALVGVRITRTPYVVEVDRHKAIELAIQEARRGDIVLLAGKGHEKVQILKDGTVPFDDVEVAAGVLRQFERS